MRRRRVGWRYGLVGIGVVLALAGGVAVAMPGALHWLVRTPSSLANVATAVVRRGDLTATVTTGGRVDSSSRRNIRCELESLGVGVHGNGISTNGFSTVLSLAPDGATVKEGDVLAVLDSSDYEEILRTQRMNVDRAAADRLVAELNLQVAQTAVTEYREGLMLQNLKTLKAEVALADSDYERAVDRLGWSRRMLGKGYLPKSQVSADEFLARRLAVGLRTSRTKLSMFTRFSAPIYQRVLESDVKAAESVLVYQTDRLQHERERLEYVQRQIERCTIRAPQDGVVIYANEPNRNVRIEAGMAVHQKQRLFYLPDLSKMEVATVLHESVVRQVKAGMRAKVTVEALAGRTLEGHVESIEQLPVQNNWFSDIRYFYATVKLDTLPKGLLPGMTAEVSIQTVRRPDVLTVPTEALAQEHGRDVCYVACDDHVERRAVTLGQATPDLLEVTGGLEEGESVVLDPTHLDGSVAVTSPAAEPGQETDGPVSATH